MDNQSFLEEVQGRGWYLQARIMGEVGCVQPMILAEKRMQGMVIRHSIAIWAFLVWRLECSGHYQCLK